MLIVTLGDPLSVNIEAVASILPSLKMPSVFVLGSYGQWQYQCRELGIKEVKFKEISSTFSYGEKPGLFFIDCGGDEVHPSELSSLQRGQLAKKPLDLLREVSFKKDVAVVTAPIDKASIKEAGFNYPGHTEYFSDLNKSETIMLLAGPRLRVGLATNHFALKNVAAEINKGLLIKKLILLTQTLKAVFSIERPKIAVCGLNPHCGDGGLFGDEEKDFISPAIHAFRKFESADVEGPLPADTAFYFAYGGSYDAVLAMYHDQGLGPLKTVHFDEAVNITGGLPYLRVSPDHGPAKDLFLKKKASKKSFIQAFDIAKSYLKKEKLS